MARADLYFILNPVTGYVKVGVTRKLKVRLRQLGNAGGVPLEVIRVVPCAAEFEKPIHEAFAASRLLGEWFTPSKELLAIADGEVRLEDHITGSDAQAGVRLRIAQGEAEQRRVRIQDEQRAAVAEQQRIEAEQLEWRARSEAAARRSITSGITSESTEKLQNEATP